MCAPRASARLHLLEHEHRAALAHHEAVAVAVEGPRGVLGVVVALRGRLDRVEAGHRDRRDRRLRGAGDHHVGLAVLDHLVRVADRVDPRRAAGGDHHGGSLGAELDRDLAGQAAGHEARVEEGQRVVGVDEPLLALVRDGHVAVLEDHRAAHGRAEAHAYAVAVGGLECRGRCRSAPPSPRRRRTGCSGPSAAPRARSGPRPRGSKSISAAICERKPDGSKKVIPRVAVRPAVIISQNASRVGPPGATTPMPVTAERLTQYRRVRCRPAGRAVRDGRR